MGDQQFVRTWIVSPVHHPFLNFNIQTEYTKNLAPALLKQEEIPLQNQR